MAALIRLDEAALREALAVHRARLEGELVETRQALAELDRLIEGKEHLVTGLTVDLTLVDEARRPLRGDSGPRARWTTC